jgi:hypothetical protein
VHACHGHGRGYRSASCALELINRAGRQTALLLSHQGGSC